MLRLRFSLLFECRKQEEAVGDYCGNMVMTAFGILNDEHGLWCPCPEKILWLDPVNQIRSLHAFLFVSNALW